MPPETGSDEEIYMYLIISRTAIPKVCFGHLSWLKIVAEAVKPCVSIFIIKILFECSSAMKSTCAA